jgi:type II secretory pathway pseudopilin PulG
MVTMIHEACFQRFQSGFTYIGVLVLVAILGITAAGTADVWHTARKQEAERELLFIGSQYRQAIARYYEQSPGSVKTFPKSLKDLLRDPRTPGMKRHLRRPFPDPVTGREEWGLVKGPAGEIMGVFSLSEETPLKKANFRKADANLENKQKYAEWTFVYTPTRSPPRGTIPFGGRAAVTQPLGAGPMQKSGKWERTW